MSDDIKSEVIKKTQDALGKHIKKPLLTEKLLKKPPFRFLHDIVTSIIKETGFLQGLFTDEELNHENIKDRDGKIAFLDKLISGVKLTTGSPLTVRSTKIVAGLEPTRTNELLQAIGQALDKKLDSSQAVQEILKKSTKKAGVSENKKKTETGGAASKKETSRREKKDPSTVSDAKKNDKKDPSVKGAARGQDRKSEKQEGASDSKKRSSSNQRSSKEKDAAKPSTKPGKSTKAEPEEKPSIKSSTKLKEEPVMKDTEPEHDTKDKLIRKESEELKMETVESKPTPDEESSSAKLPDLIEKPVTLPEQDLGVGTSTMNASPEAETVKEPVERQRPVSALGRRRSSAVKQQRSSEEQVELKDTPLPSTPARSNEAEVDNTNKTKSDTPAVSSTPAPSTRPPSSVPGPARASSDNQASTAAPIPLVRPRTAARQGSARPGAPRLRNRGEVALVTDEQVKPAAVNLIVEADGVKEDQDDDDNLVVLEKTTNESMNNNIPRPDSETMRPSSQQGHLVAQILETQKELETGSKVSGLAASLAENSGHKVDIDWEASRQRERGTALKEVQRMCESIQTVTRAAHPIGKLLDSLQEDIDSMQQELEQWQNMQRSLEEQLLAEEALTIQSTQPLKEHLQQLQQAVLAQRDQISISKANILANDQRIHKLLAGGDSAQQPIFSR